MGGFIYFIGCGPLEAVKIGFTRSHPSGRLRSLQTGSASPLKLLAFVEGSQEEEQMLHRIFRPLHIHGEWFRHELKLRNFIFYLGAPSGEPAERSKLDAALIDVVNSTSTSFHPDCEDDELAYVESATGYPFRGSE